MKRVMIVDDEFLVRLGINHCCPGKIMGMKSQAKQKMARRLWKK